MSNNSGAVERLVERVHAELGDSTERWITPDGYDSVALAVLDSIYSTGHHYTGVINAVNRYRAARLEEGADPNADAATDLVSAVERWGVRGLVERTNAWRTSPQPGAPTKAEAAYGAARTLVKHGLNTVEDVRAQLTDPARQEASTAKHDWLALPGQRSGLTWAYFLMLCGVPDVKADRMVIRFVTRAAGRNVTAKEARQLVTAAAGELDIDAIRLDHAIWRLESGRPVEYETL